LLELKNESSYEYLTNYNLDALNKSFAKTYFLNFYYLPKFKIKGFDLPYFMNPLIYKYGLDKVNFNLNLIRIKKILFLGYPVHYDYNLPYNKIFFNKINRYKVTQFIKNNFPDVFLQSNYSSFYFKLNRVPVKNYLNYLAKFDFYLCLPGFIMPFSHNVVEAMRVGAIPVIQYPELFSPELKDRVNCLVFKDLDDLKRINSYVNKLTLDEIKVMRKNVLLYYNSFMNPSNLLAKYKFKHNNLNCVVEKVSKNINKMPFNLRYGLCKNVALLFNYYFIKSWFLKLKNKF